VSLLRLQRSNPLIQLFKICKPNQLLRPALPKAVCKFSKEQLKAYAKKYEKLSVQKADAANYEKQAAAVGLAYKF
jgi:hypothetical protein